MFLSLLLFIYIFILFSIFAEIIRVFTEKFIYVLRKNISRSLYKNIIYMRYFRIGINLITFFFKELRNISKLTKFYVN